MMFRPARAATPGKIILFGEHAVVHNQPALAAPLRAVQAVAEAAPQPPGSGCVVCIPAVEQRLTVRGESVEHMDALQRATVYPVQLTLATLGAPIPDLCLTLSSSIPIASGLGSGAALAAALVRVVAEAAGAPLSLEEQNRLVYEVEKQHHGTPSGIDNTVIVFDQPVFFRRGDPIEQFHAAAPFTLLVADTGISSPTKMAVADVGTLYAAEPQRIGALFERIGALANAGRQAITHGEIAELGALMNENHALLRELTVSSEQLDHLCAVAVRAGASGAKLSGGGRGGNLIALVDESTAAPVEHALLEAGAVRVIRTEIH